MDSILSFASSFGLVIVVSGVAGMAIANFRNGARQEDYRFTKQLSDENDFLRGKNNLLEQLKEKFEQAHADLQRQLNKQASEISMLNARVNHLQKIPTPTISKPINKQEVESMTHASVPVTTASPDNHGTVKLQPMDLSGSDDILAAESKKMGL